MSSNKNARIKLEKLYGKECFIEKLHLRKDKNRKYSSKAQMKRMKQLTYHHIKPKSKGGRATVENGALLSTENHEWFHKQNESTQNKLNQAFQDYKLGVAIVTTEGIEKTEIIDFSSEDCIKIKLETNKQRRAREKAETRKMWEEYR